ncbi:MAG: hypothetical protein R3Y29_00760 [bacterium]
MELDKLGVIIKIINTNLHKQVNNRLKDIDLSITQGIALICLDEAENKELPIKALEKIFETAQPTTLGVINRLEQKNLVTTHLTQQRTKIVKITEEGCGMIEGIKIHIKEVEKLFFKDFTEGEKILLLELLEKAKNNIL